MYHDPHTFKPERFLGEKPEADPRQFAFGFGRRVCPGRALADSNIYLTMSYFLAVFDISKPVRNGNEIDVEPYFMPGIVSHPAPFDYSIKPRSAEAVELIKTVEKQHPWEESHARDLGHKIPK